MHCKISRSVKAAKCLDIYGLQSKGHVPALCFSSASAVTPSWFIERHWGKWSFPSLILFMYLKDAVSLQLSTTRKVVARVTDAVDGMGRNRILYSAERLRQGLSREGRNSGKWVKNIDRKIKLFSTLFLYI